MGGAGGGACRFTSLPRIVTDAVVGSLVFRGGCRPVGNDRAAPRRKRPPPAAQKPAYEAGNQINEHGAEAENGHDNPPSPSRETVHVVNILARRTKALLRGW